MRSRNTTFAMLWQVMAAAYVILFVYYLQASIVLQPFWDMYFHVLRYLEFREGSGSWLAYLWEPHVQHRHVWMRLLMAFDVEAFSGAAYPFIASAAVCQAAAAWLLWRETRRIDHPALRPAGWLIVMLVLTAVSAAVCAIPMYAVYPQTLVFSILALVLFDVPDSPQGGGSGAAWRRGAALLAAVAAALANAVAFLVWPILTWLAWRTRAGTRWIAGVPLAGAVFITLALYGLPLGAEGTADAAGAGQLLRRADYLLAYLGLPWTRADALALPGRAIGAALLAAALWALMSRGLRPVRGDRLERLGVALVMFSLGSALLAAAGRVDVGGDVTVPVRYTLFVAPLHVGLLFLALPWLMRQWEGHRGPLVRAGMLGAGALLLVQQVVSGETAAAVAGGMRATIERFHAGEVTSGMSDVVFDNLQEAREASDRIRAARLYRLAP